jgi:hypothetical protein
MAPRPVRRRTCAGFGRLPRYVGEWCESRNDDALFFPRGVDGCDVRHGNLTVTAEGMSGFEYDCRFVSVKRTGRTLPASTKPTRADWIPVMSVVARCSGEGSKWSTRLELSYNKGSLTIKRGD